MSDLSAYCDDNHAPIKFSGVAKDCPLCACRRIRAVLVEEGDRRAAVLEERITEQAGTIDAYKQELGI